MKKHYLSAALAFTAFMGFAADAGTDPVLMTVDGHKIHVSEFEYLYNKNNNQQFEPQTMDQYLDMFATYKLKVAEAQHAGIDKTESFIKEFDKFRKELAAPYLIDNSVKEQIIQESYNHRLKDVKVSHIMMSPDEGSLATLDSIRTAILNGTTTFEAEAQKWSVDRSSSRNGGLMGYVSHDRFPWAFEQAAYNTPEGQISPVINSGMGYHIIRVESSKPTDGEVNASHILLLTRGMDSKAAEKQKVRMDSIYNVIRDGADFAEIAKKYSQDPGSARNGGNLGWFGHGTMVAEFDSACFALKDGELSKPFATSFGYHIVKRVDSRKPGALDETMRKEIEQKIAGDERANKPAEAKAEQLMKEYGATVDNAGIDKVRGILNANAGGYDSTAIAQLKSMDFVVGTYNGGTVSIADAMAFVMRTASNDVENGVSIVGSATRSALKNAVLENARDNLAQTNAEYRNLLNEYRDGILLYEISNQNVWDKAAKDKEGLEAFFKKNIKKYKWEQPKFKSYIFFTPNDSTLNEVLEYAKTVNTAVPADFMTELRNHFGRNLKIERVIAAKGENAITDYLGFGGPKPTDENKTRWKHYAAFNGRIINAPEEAADVRGAAVTDYQQALEDKWVKDLHKKYKVTIDRKVFKAIKENHK